MIKYNNENASYILHKRIENQTAGFRTKRRSRGSTEQVVAWYGILKETDPFHLDGKRTSIQLRMQWRHTEECSPWDAVWLSMTT